MTIVENLRIEGALSMCMQSVAYTGSACVCVIREKHARPSASVKPSAEKMNKITALVLSYSLIFFKSLKIKTVTLNIRQ